MKIIGFAYIDGHTEMVLKGDSSLLNGRKPMFVPDWTHDLRFTPCIVLRVCRLGKNIAARFGCRYYDAVAPGADFVAHDVLENARTNRHSWLRATGFDFSLSVGEFGTDTEYQWSLVHTDGTETPIRTGEWVISPDEAVHRVSEVMTIRQGDLIYIQQKMDARTVSTNEILRAVANQEEKIYCKIK